MDANNRFKAGHRERERDRETEKEKKDNDKQIKRVIDIQGGGYRERKKQRDRVKQRQAKTEAYGDETSAVKRDQ